MLGVKIEYYSLDWYLSNLCFSPIKIVLCNRIYDICVKCFQAIAKSSKKENAIYLKYVLHRLRHMDVWQKHNSLHHAKLINR